MDCARYHMQHLTQTKVVDATLAFAHLEGLQDIWIYCCKGRRLPAIFIYSRRQVAQVSGTHRNR